VEQMIDEIYRKGSKHGWKPPPKEGGITGANSNGASGRNTPDLYGISAPNTPAKGIRLSVTSATILPPGVAVVPKESPLK